MSLFTKIPNQTIKDLAIKEKPKERHKLNQIYTYCHIMHNISGKANSAICCEIKIAKHFINSNNKSFDWNSPKGDYYVDNQRRSITNYIKYLKSKNLFKEIKKERYEDHYENRYFFVEPNDGYSIIWKDFYEDESIPTEHKGLLILLNTLCLNGTNHFYYKSYEDIAKNELHMDSDLFRKMVKDLKDMNQIIEIDKCIIIINENFRLYTDETRYENIIYGTIYQFCIEKGVVPPCKNETQMKNFSIIEGKRTDEGFMALLHSRFPKLPKEVTLSYFAQGLQGIHAEKQEHPDLTVQL